MLVKKILKNPGKALEIAANIGTAAASKNLKLIAATAPNVIKFVHQEEGYTCVKFIKYFYTINKLCKILINK